MTTEERLEKFERELSAAKRRNRLLLAAVALTIGGLFLAWSLTRAAPTAWAQEAGAVGKVIRANEFILEDENGKARARLTMTKDGPVVGLSDEKGNPRAIMSELKDGPALTLWDENHKVSAMLTAFKYGSRLILSDEKGEIRAGLAVTKDGPELQLIDEEGKPRATNRTLRAQVGAVQEEVQALRSNLREVEATGGTREGATQPATEGERPNSPKATPPPARRPVVTPLSYKIVERKDYSYAGTPRMAYRVVFNVSDVPTEEEVKVTCDTIWRSAGGPWKEFTVFGYLPEMDTGDLAFAVATFVGTGQTSFKLTRSALYGTKWWRAEWNKIPIKDL